MTSFRRISISNQNISELHPKMISGLKNVNKGIYIFLSTGQFYSDLDLEFFEFLVFRDP
jgi:hypothetical protein